jgi:hypothetical protein
MAAFLPNMPKPADCLDKPPIEKYLEGRDVNRGIDESIIHKWNFIEETPKLAQ